MAATPLPQQNMKVDPLKSISSFPVGAAVDPSQLKQDNRYTKTVTTHYNSITPENAMKFGAVQSGENTFDFTDGDYLINFAASNNIRVHGHNLIWHAYLPSWVYNFSGDSFSCLYRSFSTATIR